MTSNLHHQIDRYLFHLAWAKETIWYNDKKVIRMNTWANIVDPLSSRSLVKGSAIHVRKEGASVEACERFRFSPPNKSPLVSTSATGTFSSGDFRGPGNADQGPARPDSLVPSWSTNQAF